MSAENEVRKASELFYAALNRMGNGEKGVMADAWSHDAGATAMHPIGGRTVGWDAVRDSFDEVASLATDARIGLKEQLIRVVGDLAYELGVEYGDFKLAGQALSLEHRVTNIYRREASGWKLVHHHTDISPGMLDIVRRMQAK